MDNKPDCLHLKLTRMSSLALVFLLGSVSSATISAQSYNLVDLGADVSPTDINNEGVVVGAMNTSQYPTTAFIRDTRAEDSENQEIVGGTVAHAINEDGLVAGSTLTGAFLADYDTITRDWDEQGAWGINVHGFIAGNKAGHNPYRATSIPYDPAVYEGSKWTVMGIANVYPRGTRQGVYADIYRLLDLNDEGFSVGSRSRYGLAGSSAILVVPPFSGVKDASDVVYLPTPYGGSAAAINNLNMIVGTTGNDSRSGNFSHAFLYDYSSDALIDLGTLKNSAGEDGLRSSAADINDSGQVVGSSWLVSANTSLYDPTQYHAFLWEDDQMTDLNDLIDPKSGWILTAATAINEYGDIVGTALWNGEAHGFLLTSDQPPIPPPTNEPPVAVAVADTVRGKAPLTVTFSASDSFDPEDEALTYAWDFDGGSATDSTVVGPVHTYTYTYTDPGTYLVSLTVTDLQNQSSQAATLQIWVKKGNRK